MATQSTENIAGIVEEPAKQESIRCGLFGTMTNEVLGT